MGDYVVWYYKSDYKSDQIIYFMREENDFSTPLFYEFTLKKVECKNKLPYAIIYSFIATL